MTIDAAYALYEKFDDSLSQAGNFIEADVLKTLVISYMKHHSPHGPDNLPLSSEIELHFKKIENYKTSKAIVRFLCTNNFVNYLSHGLLKKLSRGADCPFLPDGEYQKDLTCFLHSHLSSFPDIFSNEGELKLHPPKGLPLVTIHLKANWMNKSLHELTETVQKNLCGSSMGFDFLILVNIILSHTHSSLAVVFAIWPCSALSFFNEFTTSKDVLKANGVTVEFSKELTAFSGQSIGEVSSV